MTQVRRLYHSSRCSYTALCLLLLVVFRVFIWNALQPSPVPDDSVVALVSRVGALEELLAKQIHRSASYQKSTSKTIATLQKKASELESKVATLEVAVSAAAATQENDSYDASAEKNQQQQHATHEVDAQITELDDEAKALCRRAQEFGSLASLQEQIKFLRKEGGFTSQMYQDATLLSILGSAVLRGGGEYADVAAAHPRKLSNTFIFDKCYNWRGLCVEADPLRAKALKEQRSCTVVDTCVSEVEGEEVQFYTVDTEDGTLSNGIANIGGKTGQSQTMKCKRMSNIFLESNVTRVDIMSLDVESAEPLVLAGIDWSEVTIELIVMEINKHTIRKEGDALKESARRIIDVLEAQHYMPVLELFPRKGGMPIEDCTSVLLGQSVRSVFQPNRKENFDLGVWRRQDVLFVRRGGLYEDLVTAWVYEKAKCG